MLLTKISCRKSLFPKAYLVVRDGCLLKLLFCETEKDTTARNRFQNIEMKSCGSHEKKESNNKYKQRTFISDRGVTLEVDSVRTFH